MDITDPITVQDTLDADLTYISYSANGFVCTYSASTRLFECKKSTGMVMLGSEVIKLKVTLSPDYIKKDLTNVATVTCLAVEKNCDNNTTTHKNPTPDYDISVIKMHEGEFMQGKMGVYNIKISNEASVDHKTQIDFTDTLPKGLTIDSFVAPANLVCTVSTDKTVINCALANGLKKSENAMLKLIVNIDSNLVGDIANTAEVKTKTPEKNYNNNKSTDIVRIVAKPAPELPRTGGVRNDACIFGVVATLVIVFLLAIARKRNRLNA